MEIKEILQKPVSDDIKNKFIAKHNHLRHIIKFYNNRLEAWGYTTEELLAQENAVKRQEILKQLDSLDIKSIRAIRAGETEYIALYEEEAKKLRKQLQEL